MVGKQKKKIFGCILLLSVACPVYLLYGCLPMYFALSEYVLCFNSLSTIALRRPSFYGRILPVILGLDHSHSGIKGVLIGADNTLKKAFISLLQCTHPSATPVSFHFFISSFPLNGQLKTLT